MIHRLSLGSLLIRGVWGSSRNEIDINLLLRITYIKLFLLDLDLKLLRTVLTCSASEHLEIEKLEKVAPTATAQQNSKTATATATASASASASAVAAMVG
ncbi:hypothetical protein V1477_002863 [Vespula maculifrons]|uniref:Uncharacterized protein n=1 Tax=Vespula maculifrons TaxID=7453 RepID=A0ABD2CV21_VESMC